MVESFLRLTEHLVGDRLAPFARFVHVVVAAIVALAWIYPLLASYLSERRKSAGTYWVSMWHCRKCAQFNPPDFVVCQTCKSPIELHWWEKWLPEFFVDVLHNGAKFLVGTYRAAGWVLFYGVTAFAFVNLRLYSFAQYPLQELIAGFVMLLLLLTLHFFGRAFNARLESPFSRLTDLVSAVMLSGFLAVFGFLWAAAPFPPDKPLAYMQSMGDGRVRLMTPGGLQRLARGVRSDGRDQVTVQFAEIRWPLLYVDQTFVTRLSGRPVLDRWTLLVFDSASRALQRDEPHRPRVVLLDQTFLIDTNKSYALRRSRGSGLLLEERAP